MVDELTEVEIQRLRRQDQTVQALMANPKAKKKIFEAYKEVNPQATIPELDIEEAAAKPVKELQAQFSELQKKLDEDKAEREREAKLATLTGQVETGMAKLRRAGWTDDGLAEVRKLMDERGIIDPEIAAAFYEKQHPPQMPATPSGIGGWNFMEPPADDDAYVKALTKDKSAADNESLVMQEARKTLNEFRGAQQRR
ncbi:MAG: hypothetical protein KGL39_17280 [Patescibacteria group bacterium]|nr:hypothetical protein [Patescibacteria group bacterium]